MTERNARRRLAARMLPVQGILLIVVAVIHLVMTAEIGRIVASNTTARAFDFLWPPYELDHIVVGVLLFVVGLIAMLCAGGIRDGDTRIWRIALVNALGVLALSPAVALTVGLRYFAQAPAFLIAAVILAIVGLWMVVPLLFSSARRSRPQLSGADHGAIRTMMLTAYVFIRSWCLFTYFNQ